MPRRPLIAANWKMYKNTQEAKSFMSAFLPKVGEVKDRDILICPPFTLIHAVDQARQSTHVLLGAQNMHFEESGAFTGEVAPSMLKDLHCEFVLIGHSERRWVFGETNEMINRKVLAAIQHGLIPVLCVGEKLEEREKNQTENIVLDQLALGLKNVPEAVISSLIIAYEPVWAIGTGKNASTEDARKAIALIREFIHSRFGSNSSEAVRILYGGSVKPANFAAYMAEEGIDGGLVGGASLDSESFAQLVHVDLPA